MRNQFFDPGFLFDFYSVRGSTAAPCGCSNVSWCGLVYFRAVMARCSFQVFFANLFAHGTKTRRARVLTFGNVGERQTLYSKLIENSAYVNALRR